MHWQVDGIGGHVDLKGARLDGDRLMAGCRHASCGQCGGIAMGAGWAQAVGWLRTDGSKAEGTLIEGKWKAGGGQAGGRWSGGQSSG